MSQTSLKNIKMIQAEKLSKLYHLGRVGQTSLRESLGSLLGQKKHEKPKSFWALKDVSFSVGMGEVLGIIGKNGAGKSTLLKILSRITEPTEGHAQVLGRVASLLEVGTGFHPELSGRENVFLNGAILGMRKREIEAKYEAIIDFAEIKSFENTPVKHYSSGMYMRLAFSVAAHLDPDILLIDEVLAVGDYDFQKKCVEWMARVSKKGQTILFVSHNLPVVANLCQRAILLERGSVSHVGRPEEVIAHYLQSGKTQSGVVGWAYPDACPKDPADTVRMRGVKLYQENAHKPSADIDISKELNIEIEFENRQDAAPLYTTIWLKDHVGTPVLSSGSTRSASFGDDEWYDKARPKGLYRALCQVPANFLNEGMYSVSAIVGKGHAPVLLKEDVLTFQVHDTGAMRKEYYGHWHGTVRPKLYWNTKFLG